jgi:protocatechuate 3,4-dioxygenase beta subunit
MINLINSAKRCAAAAGSMNAKRYAKRMAEKRTLQARANSTVQITTEAPFYDVIQNDTCVLTPEVTTGPYIWPESQTLRQDMTEGQSGVPLALDIGLLDMATCEPLSNALVDLWHCNATGSYSSFTKLSPNTPFVELLQSLNLTEYEIGVNDLHTDDTTFLRGMWPSDQNGMLEIKTIFPGFYVERAIHIHARVYTNWTLRANGTLVSRDAVSTGQLYFEEPLQEQIMALEPYASHTEINRTTNAEDTLYSHSSVTGYYPVINVVAADGENVENSMIGFITIGVDTTAIETTILGGLD